MIADYSVANTKSSLHKKFTTIFLLISSADIYAACTIDSTAYNEAGRTDSGVTSYSLICSNLHQLD